jgi:Cu/Ag efflux pump CusA
MAAGELKQPSGVTYLFSGNYVKQIHAQKTLAVVLPLTLFIIFLLIYFQFPSAVTTSLVFTAIFVCWGGGLLFIHGPRVRHHVAHVAAVLQGYGHRGDHLVHGLRVVLQGKGETPGRRFRAG